MGDIYDDIQYVLPKESKMYFSVLPMTKAVGIRLLDGEARLYNKVDKMPFDLGYFVEFPIGSNLCLVTDNGCSFFVRGSHRVFPDENGRVNLFTIKNIPIESYSFELEEDVQLQIFPVKSAKQESSVTISSCRGAPEISGFKLSRETIYHLSPFSPVLLESSDDRPYSIYIKGLNRKVKLSVRNKNHHKCVNDAKSGIFSKCLLENQLKPINLTILVLGPKNVGKTSFCQLLVYEALEKRMTPFYVDLNVKRNSSVPGALSLSEIQGRIDSTFDLRYNIKTLLHFGSVDCTSENVHFYDHLVKIMSKLFSLHLKCNRKKKCFSVIDTDGSQGESNTAIKILLESFTVDLVVYIGDRDYYKYLESFLLRNKPSFFIPKPTNAEQPNDFFEVGYCRERIQKYFLGSTVESSVENICTVALHDFVMYKISLSSNGIAAKDEKNSPYEIERLDLYPSLLNHLFGVSKAEGDDLTKIAEVKYYVYLKDVDMIAKTATFDVPESENFNGGILLIGPEFMLEENQIIQSGSSATA